MTRRPFISRAATVGWLACALWAGSRGSAADNAVGKPAAADPTADTTSPVPQAPVAGPVAAPVAAPPASLPPTHSALDSEPIRRHGNDSGSGTTGFTHSQGMELSRVGFALALVIALIFFLRWLGRKIFQQPGIGQSTRAVQILARTPLAPRQHIVLLRVGRRVIVVGECGAQMNPLCEISDGDEVAALLGQLQDEKSKLPSRAFGALFQRAKRDISGNDNEEDPAAVGDAGESETTEAEPEHEQERAAVEQADEPAISDTRSEITGLMAKIRVLSTHFRNGPA